MKVTDSGGLDQAVFGRLLEALPEMSPQLRKAARYVLDNPNDVGVSSIREVAEAAEVTANSLVRMARAAGFEGYEDLRRPFREALRTGRETFPDRARWLQGIARGGRHARLFGQMATMTLENCEQLFSDTTAAESRRPPTASLPRAPPTCWGSASPMRSPTTSPIWRAWRSTRWWRCRATAACRSTTWRGPGPEDVVLAMTFKPYRSEVVDAVRSVARTGRRPDRAERQPDLADRAPGRADLRDSPDRDPAVLHLDRLRGGRGAAGDPDGLRGGLTRMTGT